MPPEIKSITVEVEQRHEGDLLFACVKRKDTSYLEAM
jgi:hypothetical protein